MRPGRLAVLGFLGSLVVVNGPVFVYRAITHHATPYGSGPNARSYWLIGAAVNVALGLAGVRYVIRKDQRGRQTPVPAPPDHRLSDR